VKEGGEQAEVVEGDVVRKLEGVPQKSSSKSIKERLLTHLESKGIPREEIGVVELVTTPRLFGHAFNPLSVYFCFSSKDSNTVRVVVLEVNNTFDERHLYLCYEKTAAGSAALPRKGFHSSYHLPRAFHVSPFNDRTGMYEAHIGDPTKPFFNVLLVMRGYGRKISEHGGKVDLPIASSQAEQQKQQKPIQADEADDDAKGRDAVADLLGEKHFMAKVSGRAYPATNATILYILFMYPITLFMTVPRIMWEAGKLAYVRGLPVHQRPNPYSRQSEAGGTILYKVLKPFERFCMGRALRHLTSQCLVHNESIRLTFVDPDLTSITIPSTHTNTKDTKIDPICIQLRNYWLFTRLVLDGDDVGRALAVTYVRGDWIPKNEEHLKRFLKVMTRKTSADSAVSSTTTTAIRLARWARRRFNRNTNKLAFPFTSQKFAPVDTAPTPSAPTSLDNGSDPVMTAVANTPVHDLIAANATLTLRDAVTMWKGATSIRAEETWFAGITTFAWNPYEVAERIVGYAKEKREAKGVELVKVGAREMVWDDSVPAVEREKRSFETFWRVFEGVVGTPGSV
ncbi:hypothetical protein HK102_006485, partial [Quaeritorhiza haematococci]